MKYDSRETQPLEEDAQHVHDFRIQHRVVAAESLGVDLVELAITALLRAFMPEHGPEAEELLRYGIRLKVVLDISPDNGRRRFGTQGEPFAFAVGKRVHLLFDDVCAFSDSPGEQFEFFHNRGPDFTIAEVLENLASCTLDLLPPFDLAGENVVHPSDGLDAFHLDSLS